MFSGMSSIYDIEGDRPMAAQRRRSIAKDEPVSLRRGGKAPTFTDEQMLIVAVFIVAALQGDYGIYLKLNAEGNNLRMKFYGDDDNYADNLSNQENMIYTLADFAAQLKVKNIFDGLVAAMPVADAPSAPESDGKEPADSRTPKRP
jgi:hypothetical protein